jgi:hypothetical protein
LRLASLFPKPDQAVVLRGTPLDVRFARTIPARDIVSAELNASIADLERVRLVAQELGLRDTRRIAEAYVTWCEFLHPDRRDGAVRKLRSEMAEPKALLGRLQFAFAYDREFDPEPVERYLARREQFGGLDDEELSAKLVLGLHGNAPRSLADFLAKNRSRLEAILGGAAPVLSMEIQALSLAGDATSARLLFDQKRELFDADLTTVLEGEIAKADGLDPVAESKRVFESLKTAEALRALLNQLVRRRDHRAIGHYAELLYQMTNDPIDIVMAANGYAQAGANEEFLRLLRASPFIEGHDPVLARHYAWQLFQRGELPEAGQIAEKLKVTIQRDLELETAVAIETGHWERLALPLGRYLEDASNHTGIALIRAAHLAQASGQGSFVELMDAAVKRANDDPHVLIGAYSMVLEEGLEERKPEAAAWFRRALDLSGDDGPVRRFELKELLSDQLDWNEHSRRINDAIAKGDLPLTFAARGLRTTAVDVILGNLLRNSALTDPRKRVAVPLFSGRRAPSAFGEASRIALDVSTLMVAGYLGLLPRILNAYVEIVIPAGALYELFEGRARLRQFQKSRIERARDLQDAIARGRLKVLPPSASGRDVLSNEVGIGLSALLRAARARDGVVVRPSPVKRLNSGGESDADLCGYRDVLSDMHAVLRTLVESGVVDQSVEQVARSYFEVQDKGWESAAPLARGKPIFIDGLALVYLQTVNLLDPFLSIFPETYIDFTVGTEVEALVDYDRYTSTLLEVIDDIRGAVGNVQISDKLLYGAIRVPSADDEAGPPSSTLNLAYDLRKADVAVIDDRALNKELFIADRTGHRARLATFLDLLEDLKARGVLSEAERQTFRHRLRAAGAALVPIETEEAVVAALRSGTSESAEFRTLGESLGLASVAEVPRFPAEIFWFSSVCMSIQRALIQVWQREADAARAAHAADYLLNLRPDPADWATRWESGAPPGWIDVVNRVMTASLAFPVELQESETVAAYNEWLESRVLGPLRIMSPQRYRAVVESIRTLISGPQEASDDDG